MGKCLLKISRIQLCKTIVATLLNKFDFFLIVEGSTGTGKSTLAIQIARGVKSEFKRLYDLKQDTLEYYYERVIKKQKMSFEDFCKYLLELQEKDAYKYNPYEDLIYTQKEMIKSLRCWNRIFIPDEMINITFNRDFHGEEQKKIIKLINMYRDHRNLIIASVPQFNTLDVQIKNLCKMRISVARRGVGVVQTPNKIMYGKDKWDSINNEKIEREWLVHGGKPKYTKLTTARGLVAFPPLSPQLEAQYQSIKNAKRSNIVEKEMGIPKEEGGTIDPIEAFVQRLLSGGVRNAVALDGLSIATGLSHGSIRNRISKRLNELGKPAQISHYYYDKKVRKANENDEVLDNIN